MRVSHIAIFALLAVSALAATKKSHKEALSPVAGGDENLGRPHVLGAQARFTSALLPATVHTIKGVGELLVSQLSQDDFSQHTIDTDYEKVFADIKTYALQTLGGSFLTFVGGADQREAQTRLLLESFFDKLEQDALAAGLSEEQVRVDEHQEQAIAARVAEVVRSAEGVGSVLFTLETPAYEPNNGYLLWLYRHVVVVTVSETRVEALYVILGTAAALQNNVSIDTGRERFQVVLAWWSHALAYTLAHQCPAARRLTLSPDNFVIGQYPERPDDLVVFVAQSTGVSQPRPKPEVSRPRPRSEVSRPSA